MRVASRKDQTLAVLGLGSSGTATASALIEGGAQVLAWDDSADARGAARIALSDPSGWDWRAVSALVPSPGVPLTHPVPHPLVARARTAGCPVIGDIELLGETVSGATLVGITGTNGKSTTTALLGHVLVRAGLPVAVGGNLGPPALGLPALGDEGIYVLELSSYQLDLIVQTHFDIAVLLNITADHLDRHGGMDGYVAAKRRIFRKRAGGPGQTAVIGLDDEISNRLGIEIARDPDWRTIPIAVDKIADRGVYAIGGQLFDGASASPDIPVADLRGIQTLPGSHNHQNAAAAFAAASALGVDAAVIAEALESYPGLPHRQEMVARIGDVAYVNDSKATNGEAALRAIRSYDRIYWIAGGLAKADGLEAVLPELHRVRHAYLIGEAEDRFAAEIGDRIPTTRCGALDRALEAAHAAAQTDGEPGGIVLLSPACASFDQWPSFGARGDAFRDRVRTLAGSGEGAG